MYYWASRRQGIQGCLWRDTVLGLDGRFSEFRFVFSSFSFGTVSVPFLFPTFEYSYKRCLFPASFSTTALEVGGKAKLAARRESREERFDKKKEGNVSFQKEKEKEKGGKEKGKGKQGDRSILCKWQFH